MSATVYHNVYLPQNTLNREIIDNLAKKLVTEQNDKTIIKPFFSYVNNILVKFGFLLYARDSIDKVNGNDADPGIIVNYHLANFIFDTKALLDSLSIFCNEFYHLGFSGGNIDLNKGTFFNTLLQQAPRLRTILTSKQNWVQDVKTWRDALIHRKTLVVAPHVKKDHEPSFEELGRMKVSMPKVPISINELVENRLPDTIWIEIDSFCDDWINQSRTLVEKILDSIEQDFTN